ncbi:MAG: DMT family transporter [Eubacteriales bacterium]|nr:DMT family transporter [Eubacteriales bacterium]
MTNTADRSLKIRNSVFLLLAAFLWGTTFVAQDVGMQYVGPYTYNTCRFLLGFLVLFPVAFFTGRIDPLGVNYTGIPIPNITADAGSRWKQLLTGGAACGLILFLGGSFQQVGIVYTTAGKSGFVTALYIVLVPVFGLFLHKKCTPLIWLAIVIAIIGFYLLCIKEGFSINIGDLITLGASVSYAMHILTVDHFVPNTNAVQLSCTQFLFAGLLSVVPMLLFETPTIEAVIRCAGPIAYAGILSAGVACTLQIIGQRGLNPTLAALLMSLESVISALAGWLVLGDVLSTKEFLGCVLVFTGVILAQIPFPERKR